MNQTANIVQDLTGGVLTEGGTDYGKDRRLRVYSGWGEARGAVVFDRRISSLEIDLLQDKVLGPKGIDLATTTNYLQPSWTVTVTKDQMGAALAGLRGELEKSLMYMEEYVLPIARAFDHTLEKMGKTYQEFVRANPYRVAGEGRTFVDNRENWEPGAESLYDLSKALSEASDSYNSSEVTVGYISAGYSAKSPTGPVHSLAKTLRKVLKGLPEEVTPNIKITIPPESAARLKAEAERQAKSRDEIEEAQIELERLEAEVQKARVKRNMLIASSPVMDAEIARLIGTSQTSVYKIRKGV